MNEALQDANQSLEEEIIERQRVERALQQSKEELEIRVSERTAELHYANKQLQEELSERKRAEKELKFSNSMMATEQEVSLDGILFPLMKMIGFFCKSAVYWYLEHPAEFACRER